MTLRCLCCQVYAYEVDGFGSYYFMDDGNSPSLLSMPYFGFVVGNDTLYEVTVYSSTVLCPCSHVSLGRFATLHHPTSMKDPCELVLNE